MCLYPLQYRVESHAGWPSLGSEAEGYVELRYFNYLCVVLIVSFYLLPDFGWSKYLVGSGGASQRADILNCVTDRSEQLGKR